MRAAEGEGMACRRRRWATAVVLGGRRTVWRRGTGVLRGARAPEAVCARPSTTRADRFRCGCSAEMMMLLPMGFRGWTRTMLVRGWTTVRWRGGMLSSRTATSGPTHSAIPRASSSLAPTAEGVGSMPQMRSMVRVAAILSAEGGTTMAEDGLVRRADHELLLLLRRHGSPWPALGPLRS